MKKVLTFTIAVLTAGLMNAQLAGEIATNMGVGASTTAGAIATVDGALGSARAKKGDYNSNEFSGSPYVNNSFLPTPLYYKDEKIGSLFYRHNALNEEVEIMKANVEGELIRSLARDKELNIRVNGKKMSFKTFITVKKRTTNGYLTQLLDGKEYDLYKRTLVKFTEGTPAQNSFVAAVPARFTQFTEYYYQKEGVNRIDEVVAKNTKLLKLLDDDVKAKTKAFLKANDLNIKNEADLIKTFEFLNEG